MMRLIEGSKGAYEKKEKTDNDDGDDRNEETVSHENMGIK
jgi:hypothetical protein